MNASISAIADGTLRQMLHHPQAHAAVVVRTLPIFLRHGDGADPQLPPNVTHGDTAHGGIKPPDLWMFARAKSVFFVDFRIS